jgi:hypothetical protein
MTSFRESLNARPWRLTCLCLVVAIGLAGCRNRTTQSTTNVDDNNEDQGATIDVILETMQPDMFELNAPRDLATRDLNSWASTDMPEMLIPEQSTERVEAALAKYADADFVKQTMREKFILRDAIYIRDCLWAASLARSIRQKGDTITGSVVRSFYQVVHEIVLLENVIPLGPFSSMLYGRGIAEDRAWAFALLASQSSVPVGVFEFENKKLPIVVGAVIGGQVYLFDVTHGIPIANPTSTDSPLIDAPATLADIIKNQDFFGSMSTVDFDYPLSTSDFKTAKFALVGDSSTWSRRMEALNNAFAGKQDAAFLGQTFASYGSGADEVLGDIVAAETAVANLLPEKSVTIWSYPETQRIARESHSPEQRIQLKQWHVPFGVPRTILGWEPLKLKPSQFKQQAARANQILGKAEAAIPTYLAVQRWDVLPPLGKGVTPVKPQEMLAARKKLPDPILKMHMLAAEQAFYWRATSQLQMASYKPASVTFDSYLRKFFNRPRAPGYMDYPTEAAYMAAIALVQVPVKESDPEDQLESNYRRAVSFMERVEPSSSRFGAAQLWLARWDAQIAKQKTKVTE